MKISIAIEKFIISQGGAERYCWDLAHYLAKQSHEVHIICMKSEPALLPNIITHHIPVIHYPQFLRHLTFAFFHFLKVKKLHLEVNLGLGNVFFINIYQPHGGLHVSWARKELLRFPPKLRIFMRYLRECNIKNFVQKCMELIIFKIIKPKIIAISMMIKNDIKFFYNYPDENVFLIPNGININKYNIGNRMYRTEIRNNFKIKKDDYVYVFVANNLKLKGFKLLVEASKLIKDLPFKLLVVGPESTWAKMQAKKNNMTDKVIFAGKLDELEKIYPACDCLVHPTYYDACSLVVLEALASGIKVITTESNGASMFISDKNGQIIPSGDIEALANAMKKCKVNVETTEIPNFYRDDESVFREVEKLLNKFLK